MRHKVSELFCSICHALDGIRHMVVRERNFRIHICAALSVCALAAAYGAVSWEWGAIIIMITVVMALETLNTAVEQTVDLITMENRPQAKTAKDAAAGMVLIAALGAVVLAVLIFGDGVRWAALLERIRSSWPWILTGILLWIGCMVRFIFYFPKEGWEG